MVITHKFLVERIYAKDVTEEEKAQLLRDGYEYVETDDYSFEMIFEKVIGGEARE